MRLLKLSAVYLALACIFIGASGCDKKDDDDFWIGATFVNADISWTVSQLQSMIDSGEADNITIIDLRQAKKFDNGASYWEYDGISSSVSDNPGHVPGAVKFSWLEFHEDNNKTKGAKPWAERAAALGNIGVLHDSKILLVSDVKLPCN